MRRRPLGVTASWLLPSLAYVVILGALGVTSKLAMRSLEWHDLLLWTAVAYGVFAVVMLLLGEASFRIDGNFGWAAISALIVPAALVLLYIAAGEGEAGKVFTVTAAYPAVTVILAAILLSHPITADKRCRLLLDLDGIVLISVSN